MSFHDFHHHKINSNNDDDDDDDDNDDDDDDDYDDDDYDYDDDDDDDYDYDYDYEDDDTTNNNHDLYTIVNKFDVKFILLCVPLPQICDYKTAGHVYITIILINIYVLHSFASCF